VSVLCRTTRHIFGFPHNLIHSTVTDVIDFSQPRLLKPQVFEAVSLSVYDKLPRDIMWVGAFRGMITVEEVAQLLEKGLERFPHLTGVICQESWKVIPAERDLRLEDAVCEENIDIERLQQLSAELLYERFMPDRDNWSQSGYLFGGRVVRFPQLNQTVIGIRISHCVVDGVGLGLFLKASLFAMVGRDVSPPQHERELLLSDDVLNLNGIPKGYEIATAQPHAANSLGSLFDSASGTTLFTLSIDEIKRRWGGDTLVAVRTRLAAWLSAECKKVNPQLNQLAVWCDVRGIQGVPQDFTGNCGCFLHFPLSSSETEMHAHWKHLTRRGGFREVAKVFSQLQAAEKQGRPLQWKDDNSVLQINIVPSSIANVNFGYGKALFGVLLARNSPGIRISTTPDKQYFLIEVELPEFTRNHLVDVAQCEGFTVELWAAEDALAAC